VIQALKMRMQLSKKGALHQKNKDNQQQIGGYGDGIGTYMLR
jgi:hypothetical protein